MRIPLPTPIVAIVLLGHGGPPRVHAATPAPDEFVLRNTQPSRDGGAPAAAPSKLKSTATEALVRFTVLDKEKGPIKGLVISVAGASDGKKRYTEETDAAGKTDVLVPIGQKYDIVFLSLGRREIATTLNVTNEPKQNINLTLRYRRQAFEPVPAPEAPEASPRFVLTGVTFDSGKATLRPESFPRLDAVAELMTYKKSARVEIAGYTDNAGNRKANQALSEKRAQACRAYLISKGIAAGRITAVGYGDQRPIAPNDTEEGRQKNRRIEATEL